VDRKELAEFRVQILSADNSTWQGEVESDGEVFAFESDVQLKEWLCKKHPQMMPKIEDHR